MPLVLQLKQETSIPIEVDGVRLEDVVRQSNADVARKLVQYGNQQVPLGDFFNVHGSAAKDHTLLWRGDCRKVKLIGTGLSAGRMVVEGNAGMHLGAEMTGGEIVVHGNAGDWVGAEMHGGRICVHGDAGHLVGAVYRGGYKGMTDGEILIDGRAGNEIGRGMRRGLIAVRGPSGDAPGFAMLAGSILLFGPTGIRVGAGMIRGTIGLFDSSAVFQPLPTFRCSGCYRPTFLRVYLRHLEQLGFPIPEGCLNATYDRYSGDLLELGRGEILRRR